MCTSSSQSSSHPPSPTSGSMVFHLALLSKYVGSDVSCAGIKAAGIFRVAGAVKRVRAVRVLMWLVLSLCVAFVHVLLACMNRACTHVFPLHS
jgi:hypothetical protein